MDHIILNMYKKYGLMVNSNRMIPLDIDGCIPVERRLLTTIYELAKDKMVKCATIDGACMGKYHPHGLSYKTIVQLYHQGFIDRQGNFGNKYGIEVSPPAASRYTECKMKSETIELAFRLIKYVPWKMTELMVSEDVKEPEIGRAHV